MRHNPQMLRELAEKLLELAATPWGPAILVTHAFLESFILPVAHDVFLITVCAAIPKFSLLFALMSTVASTLGNGVGYSIGRMGGKPLLKKIIPPKTLAVTRDFLHKYDVWATAIACFTPFPDKVFSLCAGAFHLSFPRFMAVIFLARAARFYLVAILFFIYRESARDFMIQNLGKIMLVFLGVTIVSGMLWKAVMHKLEKQSSTGE